MLGLLMEDQPCIGSFLGFGHTMHVMMLGPCLQGLAER